MYMARIIAHRSRNASLLHHITWVRIGPNKRPKPAPMLGFSQFLGAKFGLDQESGIRGACLSTFTDRILENRCDAFYVRIDKDLTVDEKRHRLNDAKAEFDRETLALPGLSRNEVKLALLKRRIANAKELGPWKDRWVSHPLPMISEPEKELCYLTDLGQYDEDHLAWLYNKASLHAVDSFFNRLRRRFAMLERPVSPTSNRGRVWYGYSCMVIQLTDRSRSPSF